MYHLDSLRSKAGTPLGAVCVCGSGIGFCGSEIGGLWKWNWCFMEILPVVVTMHGRGVAP